MNLMAGAWRINYFYEINFLVFYELGTYQYHKANIFKYKMIARNYVAIYLPPAK